MNIKLLKLLTKDSRTDPESLAIMLGMTEEEVKPAAPVKKRFR